MKDSQFSLQNCETWGSSVMHHLEYVMGTHCIYSAFRCLTNGSLVDLPFHALGNELFDITLIIIIIITQFCG